MAGVDVINVGPLFAELAPDGVQYGVVGIVPERDGKDFAPSHVMLDIAQDPFVATVYRTVANPSYCFSMKPLISLDPHYQRAVVRLIKRIQQVYGMTVLFTAHRLNPPLASMDRVLYLVRGCAAIGAVDDVMNGQVSAQLYDMPVDVLRLNGRIIVLSALGEADGDAHRHDV